MHKRDQIISLKIIPDHLILLRTVKDREEEATATTKNLGSPFRTKRGRRTMIMKSI